MTAKIKCIFSQHFFLRISRHFLGSNLLNLAVLLHGEYITACPICFLSFQAYFPPGGGKTLGAFQSIIIMKTETPYTFMHNLFFSVTFVFLRLSSQTENLVITSSFISLACYSFPLFLTTPQRVSGLPCSIHSLWKGFQVLKVHFRKNS